MSPERSLSKQAGIGLPIALFIITVLALLVAGMAQLQESSSKAVSLQIQSQRAFFAAESGVQVVLADMFVADEVGYLSCSGPSFPVAISFSEVGLRGCNVSVLCNDDHIPVITLESIGECGNGAEQASRIIKVKVQ